MDARVGIDASSVSAFPAEELNRTVKLLLKQSKCYRRSCQLLTLVSPPARRSARILLPTPFHFPPAREGKEGTTLNRLESLGPILETFVCVVLVFQLLMSLSLCWVVDGE